MSKPAARLGDMHTCPMVTPGTPPVPHVGGPISGPCVPTVLMGGMPAAVLGDMATCVGPPDLIALGSSGVLIGGKPAARMGDTTAHGGVIAVGFPTVLIGEVGPGGFSPTPPSPFDEFINWLGNLFRSEDNQQELYGNGIVIQGSPEFRAQTRMALDTLGNLPSGAQLLNDIGSSGRTVTISETTDANGYCAADDVTAAQNGTGTDSEVSWNPNHHTTDASDPVTGHPGSVVILGHELVHASHNANGTNGNGPYDSYPGQSGASARGEERATVGSGGTSVVQPNGTATAVSDHSGDTPTENSIRDDMGIPRRPTYYPSNWPGGAPW